MNSLNCCLIGLFLITSNQLNANDTLFISAIQSENTLIHVSKASVYISNLIFYQNSRIIGESNEPQLMHLADGKQMLQLIPKGSDAFSFTLGIDSSIQVKGALSGSLDPVHGFYWTWQSGYIHAKIEAEMSDVEGMRKQIIWHIGGYQAPYNSIRTITFPLLKGSGSLVLNLDAVFSSPILKNNSNIMLPGKAACEISDLLISNFSIKQ